MRASILIVFTAFAGQLAAAENFAGNWTLSESAVSYKVNHPLKTSVGTSRKTRGKGRCTAGSCDFLLAAQVASFDSGDSNRDLHMLETTKGAAFPIVTVRTSFKPAAGNVKAELIIEFAGQKATISGADIEIQQKDPQTITAQGKFTLKLSSFGIVRPALLGMAVDDEVAMTFTSTWQTGK